MSLASGSPRSGSGSHSTSTMPRIRALASTVNLEDVVTFCHTWIFTWLQQLRADLIPDAATCAFVGAFPASGA